MVVILLGGFLLSAQTICTGSSACGRLCEVRNLLLTDCSPRLQIAARAYRLRDGLTEPTAEPTEPTTEQESLNRLQDRFTVCKHAGLNRGPSGLESEARYH